MNQQIQKPWIVDGVHIQQTVHGTICEAMETAAQILLLESGFPNRSNVVTTATITREDVTFTLTVSTSNSKGSNNG